MQQISEVCHDIQRASEVHCADGSLNRSAQQTESVSPFFSHIGKNYLPTTDEVTQIKDYYIPNKITHLAEVEVEIKKLEDLRAKLTLEIESHRSLISPIHHVPSDILQEIFTACLPPTSVMSRHEAPLLLTRVCKNWRNLTFSTPHLWSSIHIPIPSFPVALNSADLPAGGLSTYSSALLTLIRGRVVAIHEWLERSKGSPLTISIYDAGNGSDEFCDLVLDMILHFSPRWKRLVFNTHSFDLARIAGLVPSQVPLLETLFVTNQTVIRSSDPATLEVPPLIKWSTSEIIKAAKLRELAYSQMAENLFDFPLKWSQMTCIALGSKGGPGIPPSPKMTLNQVAFILRSCPQLVSFSLEVVLLPGTLDQTQSTICLPSLESLSFHDSGVDVSFLFSILELPFLKHLEFNSNMRRLTQNPLEMLLPRITTLKWLITVPQFFAQGHYVKLLSHMTSLTNISIRWSPFLRSPDWSPNIDSPEPGNDARVISDDLLTWFTTPDIAGKYPVPSLETLECYTTAEFSDAVLVDFIKKKHSLPGIRQLKRLYVEFYRPQMVDVVEGIGEEISKDLKLDLRYPYSMPLLLKGPIVFHPFAGLPSCQIPAHINRSRS